MVAISVTTCDHEGRRALPYTTLATVHKTQALSIKHIVRGCIEGVFAQVKDCNMRVAFGKEGSKSVVNQYSMPSFFLPIFSTTTPM